MPSRGNDYLYLNSFKYIKMLWYIDDIHNISRKDSFWSLKNLSVLFEILFVLFEIFFIVLQFKRLPKILAIFAEPDCPVTSHLSFLVVFFQWFLNLSMLFKALQELFTSIKNILTCFISRRLLFMACFFYLFGMFWACYPY